MDIDVAVPSEATAMLPAAAFDCLQPPVLAGWPALQARWVHRIKRAALRQLHASPAGERFLLGLYLAGEEASQAELQEQMRAEAPDWLARQLEQHLADEEVHVGLFAAAIASRLDGRHAPAPQPALRADGLSRRKLARWRELMRRYAGRFQAGALVPAYAIGLAAEQTAARILRRHCDVIGEHHDLHRLLLRVLKDEERHARLCSHALQRCVAPTEQRHLEQLMLEVRADDRSFGVTGSIAMWLAGVALRFRPRPRPRLRLRPRR